MAHGTIYNAALARCSSADIPTAHLIHDSAAALSIDDALASLGPFGQHGAMEPVEGVVWRVEREGAVDFLAKYVRSDKVDGKYLPNTANSTTSDPVWLWQERSAS